VALVSILAFHVDHIPMHTGETPVPEVEAVSQKP
jgi:hypothetical protein